MLIVVSGMAFEAKIVQGADICTVYGLDPKKLEADIGHAINRGASGIISFGTAAGLSPSLPAGAVVIARNVISSQHTYPADAAWSEALHRLLPDATVSDIAGVDMPLTGKEEKSALWAGTGAVAADMESHHVARIAGRHHLPFAALRVVLDGAEVALPPAALVSTCTDGTINYKALIGSLVSKPQQLPALLQLAAHHKQAKRALMHCGGLLGGSLAGLHR